MPRASGKVQKQPPSKEDCDLAVSALLNAVSNDDDAASPASLHIRPFLNLFGAASSNAHVPVQLRPNLAMREQRQLLLYSIGQKNHLSTGKAGDFFDGLKRLVRWVTKQQEFIPEDAYQHDEQEACASSAEDDFVDDDVVTLDQKSTEGLFFLQFAAQCVTSFGTKKALDPVIEVALDLHGCIDRIDQSWGSEAVNAQTAIVTMCETWWLSDGARREELILQALPVLLESALLCHDSDIKRLYAVRSAFYVIEFEDETSQAFLNLLLAVASSPTMLKSREGKRFVSFLFGFRGLRSKLHHAIRAQIPDNKTSILADFSEIYFYAWKTAKPSVRHAIEVDTLQDLVYACIHVENTSLHTGLQIVLGKFHDAQLHPEVQELLYRLYGPVLWRSLRAANAVVRIQSAHIFGEVFPLRKDKKDTACLDRGVAAIKALLQDVDPRVRVAGSEALAKILALYWDIVPSNDIRGLLNHLVAEHASDASSAAVRESAVSTITFLLEAPQSQAVLRDLLPALGNLIHDKVEKVRLAVVKLLVRIKKVPNIKYYHIVPLDHLAARFTEEGKLNPTNHVATALTGLMVNSYFPQKADTVEQVRRTMKFLTDQPHASLVFYANLVKFRSVDDVALLTVQLLRCLHSTIKSNQKLLRKKAGNGKRRRFGKNDEATDDGEETDDSISIEAMATIAEAINVLWQSTQDELTEEWSQFLFDEFSGKKLTSILSYLDDEAKSSKQGDEQNDNEEEGLIKQHCYRASGAVLCCAGRLPPDNVGELVSYVSSLLAAGAQDGLETGQATAYMSLLCLWDMTEKVAESLASSITSTFHGDDLLFRSPSTTTRKRSSKDNDTEALVPQLHARDALKVLGEILRGSNPSSVAARNCLLNSESSTIIIEKALLRGTQQAERILEGDCDGLSEDDLSYMLNVCETYGRLILHKEGTTKTETQCSFSIQAQNLLDWTTAKVVPALNPMATKVSDPFNDPNLSLIQVEKSFDSFPASPEPDVRSGRRSNRNRTPVRLDEGLGIFGDSPTTLEDKQRSVRTRQTFAVSLLHSSCILFSEWLAVGASGADSIVAASCTWCDMFLSANVENAEAVVPAFCRLAVQLSKANEVKLLKQILVKFNDGGTVNASVGKSVTLLSGVRGKLAPVIVETTVDCVLQAAYALLPQGTEGDDSDTTATLDCSLPASLTELWLHHAGCVGSALSALIASRPGSLALARQLTRDLPRGVRASTSTNHHHCSRVTFGVQLLWMLCDADSGSKIVTEASVLVRELDAQLKGNDDTALERVMAELLQSLG